VSTADKAVTVMTHTDEAIKANDKTASKAVVIKADAAKAYSTVAIKAQTVDTMHRVRTDSSSSDDMHIDSESDEVDLRYVNVPLSTTPLSTTNARATHTVHTHAVRMNSVTAASTVTDMPATVSNMTNSSYTCDTPYDTQQSESTLPQALESTLLEAIRAAQQGLKEKGEICLADYEVACTAALESSGGNLTNVIKSLHGGNLTCHLDAQRIGTHFSSAGEYSDLVNLVGIAKNGVPIDVEGTVDLERDVERGNYEMNDIDFGHITKKVIDDSTLSRGFVVSKITAIKFFADRLGVVLMFVKQEGHGKARVIHDHSAEDADGNSVNKSTDFEQAPEVACGKMFGSVVTRVWENRHLRPGDEVLLSKMDVKGAFRQLPSNLDGILFGYMYKEHVVIDLPLQFGWRKAPGWWSTYGSALVWSLRAEPLKGKPAALQSAIEHYAHPGIEDNPNGKTRHTELPLDERAARATGGGPEDPPYADIYVDDSILVALRHPGRDANLHEITVQMASDQMVLLGEPRQDSNEPTAVAKETHWGTEREVLGWDIDASNKTGCVS
jgi:hypothetical protein